MRIFIPKEHNPDETRIPVVPATVKRLVGRGAEIVVEAGMGATCRFPDNAYTDAGASIASDRVAGLRDADAVLRLGKPPIDEVELLKEGCIHVSFLDPFGSPELVDALASKRISAICMEMIPRTTIAQKMDALSSQANLAGYVAVLVAAERLDKILPMMMTPAGTIPPARVFVIGVGVAGLQAIATAKRLGARVEAFDTRPVVEEQVRSLGAKFVKVDLGETGETAGGYAKELTEEQKAKQRDAMAAVCAQADIVITTAQVFGRRAPVIVTRSMLEAMKPGSVVIDLAIETGGNVEGAERNKEVDVNGVRVIAYANFPGMVNHAASEMYSSNVAALLEHFWDDEAKRFQLDLENDIIQGCLVTHDGEIRNEMIKNSRQATS